MRHFLPEGLSFLRLRKTTMIQICERAYSRQQSLTRLEIEEFTPPAPSAKPLGYDERKGRFPGSSFRPHLHDQASSEAITPRKKNRVLANPTDSWKALVEST